jgi:hypothetical protein
MLNGLIQETLSTNCTVSTVLSKLKYNQIPRSSGTPVNTTDAHLTKLGLSLGRAKIAIIPNNGIKVIRLKMGK